MRIYTQLNMSLPKGSVCIALGLFDGLHRGHTAVIGEMVKRAGEKNLTPCVFTFTRADGASPKAPGRLLSKELFCDILSGLGATALICPEFESFRGHSPESFVQELLLWKMGAGSVFCGENFRFGKNASGNAELLKSLCAGQAEVFALPMLSVEGAACSSTHIRSLIGEGDMEEAGKFLGRRFAVDFEVVHGRALGRTMGFPTINQPFPPDFVRPRFGVYATAAQVNGKRYSSVTNVGIKPTVGEDRLAAETHIHDFSGDLYGKNITVEFLRFIRPEMKFAGVGQLREQIQRDSEEARKFNLKDIYE